MRWSGNNDTLCFKVTLVCYFLSFHLFFSSFLPSFTLQIVSWGSWSFKNKIPWNNRAVKDPHMLTYQAHLMTISLYMRWISNIFSLHPFIHDLMDRNRTRRRRSFMIKQIYFSRSFTIASYIYSLHSSVPLICNSNSSALKHMRFTIRNRAYWLLTLMNECKPYEEKAENPFSIYLRNRERKTWNN